MPDLEMKWIDPADDRQLETYFEVARRAELEDGRPWNAFWTFPELAEMLRDQLDYSLSEALLARNGETASEAATRATRCRRWNVPAARKRPT